MDPEEDAANVNRTPAEVPCLQHEQHVLNLEASGQCTNAENVGIPLSCMHDKSETLQLLEFQDSQMSPALALLPSLDKSHPFYDSTFFQHTDAEFVALRGFPDLSVISERCPRTTHIGAADDSHVQENVYGQFTLSQHPLDVPTALLEPESSCCSLSQHSLSPGVHYKEREEESDSFETKSKIDRHMEGEEQSASQHLTGESAVNISSVVSSETAHDQPEPTPHLPNTAKSHLEPSMNIQTGLLVAPGTDVEHDLQSVLSSSREQPQGGSLPSSFQSSAVSNITVRDSRMHSHQTADRLRDQLYKGQRSSISQPGSRHNSENRSSHSGLYVTPAGAGGMHIPGLQRMVWSSGNLTAADGSFLSTHPVSQSTPAVPLLKPPPALTKLSLVHSQEEAVVSAATSFQNSHSKTGFIPSLDLSVVDQHSSATCPQPTVPSRPSTGSQSSRTVSHAHSISKEQESGPVLSSPAPDVPSSDNRSFHSGTKTKDQVSHLALGRVQSLPSLSYLQKVDAWTANQTSSKAFYDNLALKAFDDVSLKNKSQDSVRTLMLSQDMSQTQLTQAPVPSSLSGSGSPRRVDVIGAGVPRAQESLVNHSHSSLNSVVTSIQRDTASHGAPAQTDDIIPATRSLSNQSSLLIGKNNSSAMLQNKNTVKPSPLASLGRFSDVSSSFNMSSTLSSSQDSCHAEQSMQASIGAASSVVSLEVDNYAPYWTSRPTSPPQARELNIEDRIPLYLLNLGIDQSPSTILNPFTRRGPIREPEFSPTDLCTIKGSIGTPTKSTQLSEVDSPQKEMFSNSSQLSADSSSSVTHRLSVHQQGQATSQQSVRMILSQTDTPPRHHSTLHPSSSLQHSDTPQSEGLSSQLSPDSVAHAVPREEAKEDDSFVGSGTLHEIRRLLGRAESIVSVRSSLTSSSRSHRLSESDTSLVSLGRNPQGSHDSTSLSASGNVSLLLTRSSSDSALKLSSSSSRGTHQPSSQTEFTTKLDVLSLSRDESLKSRDLCVTPRRAEPEGCNATDPDKAKQPAALPAMQINVPLLTGNVPQNQEETDSAEVGSSVNSSSHGSADAGSLSDSSSESSLAVRVAKLLQSESPVSMVTSRPSTADPEDSRAREWILMKVSGRQCESLELNAEDRKRIEDIKRELLLNTQHKWSSDSEGSAQSSVGAGSQSGKGVVGVHSMDSHASDLTQKITQKPLNSNVLLYTPKQQDLESRVYQIALREGFSLPSLPSISIATTRRTPSPQFASDFPVADTLGLGDVSAKQEVLEHSGHQKGTDTNTEVAYPQQRHQPFVIPNVSDRKEQLEGKLREGSEEITGDDNKENAVKNDSQILSSIASDTAPANKSHLSHIHVTLSPSSKHQPYSVRYHPSRLSSQNSFKDVPSARHSPIMSSTGNEQFNSISNQPKSFEHKEPFQVGNDGRVNLHLQARYPQATQRIAGTSRSLAVQAAAVPTLLPYKPHGSSELFYVPQADDPELSPDRSDTTVESSHSGSDDAVPPRFNKEILGSRELEDNAVMPKHKEGIYSKRDSVKGESSNVSTGRFTNTAHETSYVSVKDMDDEDHFVPLHMEADYTTDDLHLHNRSMQEPKLPLEPQHVPSQTIRRSGLNNSSKDRTPHEVSVAISSSLDQLWRRFNEKWSMEETRPTNVEDTSLLDRLERLSRLIHSTTSTDKTVKQREGTNRSREVRGDKEEGEERKRVRLGAAPRQAWADQEDNPETVQRCTAERDESSSVSVETSSTMSTIDTERLVRAFGHHRITSKGVRSSDSLLRLHNAINKQKTSKRKPSTKHAAVSADIENTSTDDSTVTPDCLSSSSTLSMNSQTVITKKSKVKLHSKSVQAGDLEIVINGTRRHTRDVGTIFPSPGSSSNSCTSNTHNRGVQAISISNASTTNSIQTQSVLKRDSSNNKSIRTRYPNGVSWFVSADELKTDGRKENQPQSESESCLRQAWFEPYSKTQPWREPPREAIREPLRERQMQEEQERPKETRTAVGSDSNNKPSALVRLSLQEALELHRPEFVSRSRERIKRLELLVEERRIQTVFSREREELFNCPAPSNPLIPASVPRKRVVPRKEMVQRSKHWIGKKTHSQTIGRIDRHRRKYAQLPEIRKRREEEKRRAEYSTYRLNAQLFNKKVTNRVLGRRAPWQ